MNNRPVILHLDGDAFFVGVEVASRPELRGKPVVSGGERGIATALSYEAKALGIVRGMPSFQIRKLFPQVTIINSDYHTYTLYSERMKDIVRRYTDSVESYSIDECFARIESPLENLTVTGNKIKEDIKTELGITASLGISSTKVLAKIASKYKKPDGLTLIDDRNLDQILAKTSISSLWGVGRQFALTFRSLDVETALEFKQKPLWWVQNHFNKHIVEMWYELQGTSVLDLDEDDGSFKSISRSRTFRETTSHKATVYGELSAHVEEACAKARGGKVVAKHVYIFVKTKDFRYYRAECVLPTPTNDPGVILKCIQSSFNNFFYANEVYRATGITLSGLAPMEVYGDDLFGGGVQRDRNREVGHLIDTLLHRFGDHTLHLASSLPSVLSDGGIQKKPLCIPSLGKVR
jgi:DNA polymerase-4